MARRASALAFVALCAGACATEHETVVVAPTPLAAGVAVVSDAELIAQAQVACDSYGLLRGTAPYDRCVRNEFAARRPG